MPAQGKETMDAATPGNATAVVVVGGGVPTRFDLQRGFFTGFFRHDSLATPQLRSSSK